nr:MAG TPA: hypothetical protein [Caudoviricetes sp.]
MPFYLLANLLITADKGKGIEIARAMAIRGSSRGKGQLPHEKSLTYTAPVSRGNCLRA